MPQRQHWQPLPRQMHKPSLMLQLQPLPKPLQPPKVSKHVHP